MKLVAILSMMLAVSIVRAQEPSVSPEMSPEIVDPMTRPSIPVLYLTSAGKGMHKEMMITPFKPMTICPKDHPTGFSIRCGVSNAKQVDFYVNYKLYRSELYKPYFLAGNLMGHVHPFTGLDTKDKVRVGCRVATRKPVWVDLIKSCQRVHIQNAINIRHRISKYIFGNLFRRNYSFILRSRRSQ